MKWHSIVFTFLLLIPTGVGAVQFGQDSHNITNPYFSGKLGEWQFSQGVGPEWNHRIFYLHAIGTERVSGAQIGQQVLTTSSVSKCMLSLPMMVVIISMNFSQCH